MATSGGTSEQLELALEELLDYLVCPLQLALRRTEPPPPSVETRLHEVFQRLVGWIYTQGIVHGEIPSPLSIERRWEDLWWEGREKPTPESILFAQSKLEVPGGVVAQMLHHLTEHLRRVPFAPLAVGIPFRIDLAGVVVHGRLPVVREIREKLPGGPPHRYLELVVYRITSPEHTAPGEFGLASDLELSAYSLAFRRVFERSERRIVVVDLRSGKESRTTRDSAAFARLRGVVQMVVAAMQANLHHPRPGSHCQRCPYQQPCLGWRISGA